MPYPINQVEHFRVSFQGYVQSPESPAIEHVGWTYEPGTLLDDKAAVDRIRLLAGGNTAWLLDAYYATPEMFPDRTASLPVPFPGSGCFYRNFPPSDSMPWFGGGFFVRWIRLGGETQKIVTKRLYAFEGLATLAAEKVLGADAKPETGKTRMAKVARWMQFVHERLRDESTMGMDVFAASAKALNEILQAAAAASAGRLDKPRKRDPLTHQKQFVLEYLEKQNWPKLTGEKLAEVHEAIKKSFPDKKRWGKSDLPTATCIRTWKSHPERD